MSLQKQNVNKWPSANAKQVSTHKNWEEADAWMQQDKANRVVEVVQMGAHVCMGGHHKQVEWERVDKSKPFGFGWSGVSGWERSCSMVKVPPWQCPGSAPVPLQGTPDLLQGTSGGSGQLGTPRQRLALCGRPATASGARASYLQSRRFHRP